MTAEPAAATRHTCTYPGRADQVRHVRRAVAAHLTGCPAAADAVLVASELASNAVLHSRSRCRQFTIRAELRPDHVMIEAEDLGGPWRPRPSDDRPHGLTVVQALTGPEGWGVKTTGDGNRIVWARLDLKVPRGVSRYIHALHASPDSVEPTSVTCGSSGTFQTSLDGTPRP